MAPHAAVLLSLLALAFAPSLAVRAVDTHHLHFFLHNLVSGSNPTAVKIIVPASRFDPTPFPRVALGDTTVMDDPLTETSSVTSATVGRAQGYYMKSSQLAVGLRQGYYIMCVNLVLTTGDYDGSTLAVVGRTLAFVDPDDDMATTRELSVVGGTGKFRMATGYVLLKRNSSNGIDATVELDVYVTTTTIAADSSSGSAAPYGWANAVVAAALVVVALLAGCLW